MGEARGRDTVNRFFLEGFEWRSEYRDEGDFGVKNQTRNAYAREKFYTVEAKVSAGPWGDSELRT